MGKKILLIADDDEMNRRIIRRFLSSTYEVLEAENGRQALEQLESNKVDALLLDIIMPEIDGLEVLKIMKERNILEQTGVLVATSTKEKTERTALSLGADDIVSKPYDPIVIKKRLENILAVKEVQNHNEKLKYHDTTALLSEQETIFSRKAGKSAEKFHEIAKIMSQNTDNINLLNEMIQDIHKEADKIMEMFSDYEA
jgi:CheY-like chemotaxis protein